MHFYGSPLDLHSLHSINLNRENSKWAQLAALTSIYNNYFNLINLGKPLYLQISYKLSQSGSEINSKTNKLWIKVDF